VKTRSVRTKLSGITNWSELAAQVRYCAPLLAEKCSVHPKSLRRFFKARLGTTPQRWLDQLRDFEAEKLVLAGKRTKEIAYLLGYKHPADLCHHFKRARGISLKKWKLRFGNVEILPERQVSLIDNL
jgi:AraC-like DNA-binding protein